MLLRDNFAVVGTWLFRWRSYLPLLMFGLVLVAMTQYTYLGGSHERDMLWDAFCLALSFAGLGIRALVVGCAPGGTSGRNTRNQLAEQLNTSGMYSIVRHPLYLGNLLMWMGPALFPHQWQLALLVVCLFALYYERIMVAEEEFLHAKFGDEYARWAAHTPAILPRVRQWRRASLPFSGRTVLRREYSGFFGIIAVFTLLEIAGDLAVSGRLVLDPAWAIIFMFGSTVYFVLRLLKRRTRLLHVVGR